MNDSWAKEEKTWGKTIHPRGGIGTNHSKRFMKICIKKKHTTTIIIVDKSTDASEIQDSLKQQGITYLTLMSPYRYYGTGMAKSPCTLAHETMG